MTQSSILQHLLQNMFSCQYFSKWHVFSLYYVQNLNSCFNKRKNHQFKAGNEQQLITELTELLKNKSQHILYKKCDSINLSFVCDRHNKDNLPWGEYDSFHSHSVWRQRVRQKTPTTPWGKLGRLLVCRFIGLNCRLILKCTASTQSPCPSSFSVPCRLGCEFHVACNSLHPVRLLDTLYFISWTGTVRPVLSPCGFKSCDRIFAGLCVCTVAIAAAVGLTA